VSLAIQGQLLRVAKISFYIKISHWYWNSVNKAYPQLMDQPNQQNFAIRRRNFALSKLGGSKLDSVFTKPQWIYINAGTHSISSMAISWHVMQKIMIFLAGEKQPFTILWLSHSCPNQDQQNWCLAPKIRNRLVYCTIPTNCSRIW